MTTFVATSVVQSNLNLHEEVRSVTTEEEAIAEVTSDISYSSLYAISIDEKVVADNECVLDCEVKSIKRFPDKFKPGRYVFDVDKDLITKSIWKTVVKASSEQEAVESATACLKQAIAFVPCNGIIVVWHRGCLKVSCSVLSVEPLTTEYCQSLEESDLFIFQKSRRVIVQKYRLDKIKSHYVFDRPFEDSDDSLQGRINDVIDQRSGEPFDADDEPLSGLNKVNDMNADALQV
ncbi:hypothetical protein HW132_12705 [Brasilonema sp. CT11]|nr:hypothetical protein [Brasilonema sp. CT11]